MVASNTENLIMPLYIVRISLALYPFVLCTVYLHVHTTTSFFRKLFFFSLLFELIFGHQWVLYVWAQRNKHVQKSVFNDVSVCYFRFIIVGEYLTCCFTVSWTLRLTCVSVFNVIDVLIYLMNVSTYFFLFKLNWWQRGHWNNERKSKLTIRTQLYLIWITVI